MTRKTWPITASLAGGHPAEVVTAVKSPKPTVEIVTRLKYMYIVVGTSSPKNGVEVNASMVW